MTAHNVELGVNIRRKARMSFKTEEVQMQREERETLPSMRQNYGALL
jgi:hypothetical protein